MWLCLLLLVGVAWAECPDQCQCMGSSVDCSNSGLTSIPQTLPPSTQSLNLRGNRLGSLRGVELLPYSHLENLILNDNRISEIDENVLEAVPLLRRLSLSHNRVLSLSPLSSVGARLVALDLSHNRIENIDKEVLLTLPELVQLDLTRNRLRSLPSGIFQKNRKLSHIRLQGNPWHCDCRMSWAGDFLQDLGSEARCYQPKELRGNMVEELSPSSFECFEPTSESSPDHTRLKCPAVEKATAVWVYKDAELPRTSMDYMDGGNGTLVISSQQEATDFRCAYDHEVVFKRSVRQTARLTTGSPPTFKHRPRDNSYREGTVVKVHCEVDGMPRPTITWEYKRQPLINSKKHELSNGNTILKIFPFLETDVGSYSCIAVNDHGRIEHAARLQLVASVPPTIVDAPVTTTAELGQQVTFRCRARGVPQPQITWFFEGTVVRATGGRFMLSSDGSELSVPRASRQYEGVYSCAASNSVGAMVADAKLTVTSGVFDKVDTILNETTLQRLTEAAKVNVDRAFHVTKQLKNEEKMNNPDDLKRLFRFAASANSLELTKAREVYEESLRLVYAHINKGLNLPVDKLSPNVSYEAVLPVSYIQTLMELSGCQTGQVLKDHCDDMCFHGKYRSYDGQCNNAEHPLWGASSMPLLRLLPPRYENGFNTPVGWDPEKKYHGHTLPNARDVSRQIISTNTITPHSHLSAMVFQWGQWIDHDLTFTAIALARQSYSSGAICNRTCANIDPCFNIQLSPDDPKLHTGKEIKFPCMEFERNGAVCGSGETSLIFQRVTYRDQMNTLTSWLDGSGVYGNSEVQALELRDLYGDHGLLRFDIVSNAQKPYLPFEKDSEMDCRRNFSVENPMRCFLAGDVRANEQLGLTSMHTLFMREHNRIAGKLLEMNVNWDGETIYQEARKIVGAMIQHITYTEWLPLALGRTGYNELLGSYEGYDPETHPNIANAFATAAFRFGHTIINPTLFRLDNNFSVISDGHLPLSKAFFEPERILSEGGIDPLLRGLFASPLKQPRQDQVVNSELTERLFPRYHEVALDLVALNIQRSRDHALPSYMQYRRWCNLSVAETWDDMAKEVPDKTLRQKLQKLYGHPDNIDLWVGGVIEKKLPDALMGPTFACIIGDQFRRTRQADRFWYENPGVFSPSQLQQIKKSSLARILCDNGDNIDRIQKNVFMYHGNSTRYYQSCDLIPEMKLRMWMDCCEGGTCISTSAPENRRKRNIYTKKPSCVYEGKRKPEGSKWHEGPCTTCKCEKGEVWCTSEKNCKE